MAIEQGTVDVTRDIQKRTNPSSIDKIFMINPYTNEVQYIEQGQITNKVMSDMRPEIEAIKNAAFFGHASLSTVPNIELGPQFYIASQEGTYPEFGNLTVDMSDGMNILSYDGTVWSKIIVTMSLTATAGSTTYNEVNIP